MSTLSSRVGYTCATAGLSCISQQTLIITSRDISNAVITSCDCGDVYFGF